MDTALDIIYAVFAIVLKIESAFHGSYTKAANFLSPVSMSNEV